MRLAARVRGWGVMDPTVFEATMIQRVVRYVESLGRDPRPILDRAGFDPEEVPLSDRMYPIQRAARLFRCAAEELADPALGISLARASRPRDYGLIGLIFDHQPTIDEALDMLSRTYSAFLASAALEVVRDGAGTHVISSFEYEHPGLSLIRQEVLAAIFVHIRRAVGGTLVPRAVRLRSAEVAPERFFELYGIAVTFGADEDELVLDPAPLAQTNPNSDPVLRAHLMEAAEVHLQRRRAAQGVQTRLLHLSGCTVDLTEGVVRRNVGDSWLTTKERELLEYFASRRNEVVTHEEIERDVWHIGRTVVSHAPAVAIRRLRQKIEPPRGRPVNLVTVFGEGWRLNVAAG